MEIFSELLDSIVSKVEGIVAVVIMGMDGIAIEKRCQDADINIESLAAEYTTALRLSSSSTQEVGLGTLEEYMVSTEDRIAVVRMITSDYFLFILLSKGGNIGRARFELKKAKLLLAKEFVF
jgi:predicted regulator of Ras-like GTPase activity (Roadblock/LC7/MglB family)